MQNTDVNTHVACSNVAPAYNFWNQEVEVEAVSGAVLLVAAVSLDEPCRPVVQVDEHQSLEEFHNQGLSRDADDQWDSWVHSGWAP